MKIAVTGHRPGDLYGYNMSCPEWNAIRRILHDILIEEQATLAITGMALGVDQVFAEAAIIAGVPFLAAVPCDGQESRWPAESQKRYNQLLELADEVVVVTPGQYTNRCMQDRNIFMTDNCDKLVAVWNGKQSGGTYNCLQYALRIGREVIYVEP